MRHGYWTRRPGRGPEQGELERYTEVREVFDRFSSGREFRDLLAAAGLPSPEIMHLGEIKSYILPPGVTA